MKTSPKWRVVKMRGVKITWVTAKTVVWTAMKVASKFGGPHCPSIVLLLPDDRRTSIAQHGLQRYFFALLLVTAQSLEAGDDVEQFLVDATLAQATECTVEVLQQFVDVFVGALHRREAARVLTRQGFSARPEQ